MVDKALTDTQPAVLPPDPEKSGWHWLDPTHSPPRPMFWEKKEFLWMDRGHKHRPTDSALRRYRCVAPVDPPGTGAALDEARAEVVRLREALAAKQTPAP